jgi:hypothetical protein
MIILNPDVMLNFQLKTHRLNVEYNQPHFFILNRGLNSGKPLDAPCPNCFVCICASEKEKNQLYWLLFGLWQGKNFHPYLVGSVIPLVRIGDVKSLICVALDRMVQMPEKFNKNISTIRQMNQHALLIKKQLENITRLKRVLMFDLLKP